MDEQKVTLLDLQQMKRDGRKITMLSINDYPMALLGDKAVLDTILVGDSLAMTVLGYETTVPVSVEEMLHHTKAVTRAVRRAFVVGDMPFMSNVIEEDAVRNAGRFMKEGGTDAVKVEGGRSATPIVAAILKAGIPVMGHIGLTPQHISMLGGFKAQGRDAERAREIIDDAVAIEDTGAFAMQIHPPSTTTPYATAGTTAICDQKSLLRPYRTYIHDPEICPGHRCTLCRAPLGT